MKYEMCVFDMAGTTVDDSGNSVAAALCDAFRAAGFEVAPVTVNPVMGIPKPMAIRSILTDIRGSAPTQEEVLRIHADFQNRMVEYYRTSPAVKEIAGRMASQRRGDMLLLKRLARYAAGGSASCVHISMAITVSTLGDICGLRLGRVPRFKAQHIRRSGNLGRPRVEFLCIDAGYCGAELSGSRIVFS